MRDTDPRAVLGLPLDATRGEAQRAFRRLAKETHPDAGGDAAAFRTVAGAWSCLADVLPPDRRPVALSPHVLAYRAPVSRVLWTETRRPVRRDFAAVLGAEMARRAA
ncbi:MAG TPA: J domain-containing protein [Acidimicrobiia bacterium]|nr:J domain-containing protein [Acidimicrobiia bacterium]